ERCFLQLQFQEIFLVANLIFALHLYLDVLATNLQSNPDRDLTFSFAQLVQILLQLHQRSSSNIYILYYEKFLIVLQFEKYVTSFHVNYEYEYITLASPPLVQPPIN